jgi:hypothetical protein
MAKIGSSYKTKNEFEEITPASIPDEWQLVLFDPSIGQNQEYVTNYKQFVDNLEGILSFPTREIFTPTPSQTVFTLASSPTGTQITNSRLYLNGQKLTFCICYMIAGTQLTVILPYDLDGSDLLEIYY